MEEKARRELGFTTQPFDEGWRETLLHEQRLLRLSRDAGNSER
jgi:hypothetical protein